MEHSVCADCLMLQLLREPTFLIDKPMARRHVGQLQNKNQSKGKKSIHIYVHMRMCVCVCVSKHTKILTEKVTPKYLTCRLLNAFKYQEIT